MLRRDFHVLTLGAIGAPATLITAAATAAASLADVIETSSPSVVAVGSFDALKSPRFSFRGTGFAVASGQRIVTNAHVLPKAGDADASDKLAVLVPRRGGQPELRMAKRLASVPEHDLALLEIEGAPLPPLTLAPEPLPRAGTAVVLVGFPLGTSLGFVPVAHKGIVSAVVAIAIPPPAARQLDDKTLSRLRQGSFDILQLDAVAYPGNSGSPLIDVDTGRVVGVINMVFIKGTKESAISQPTGITYAIPARLVVQMLEAK